MNLDTVTSSTNIMALRRLYDHVESHTRSLKSLGVESGSYGGLVNKVVGDSGVARGGKGGKSPFSRENATRVLCTMINYSQNNYFLLFSERSVVNIDSNDFDKAVYKADNPSTYIHDDRLNASEEVRVQSLKGLGMSGHLISGPSLNECLHTGSKFDQKILDTLLRFRVHRVAVTADVKS